MQNQSKPRSFSFLGLKISLALVLSGGFVSLVSAQTPDVADALKIKPKQKTGITYDTPTGTQVDSCKVEKALEKYGKPGWVVYDGAGRLLRQFLDVDRDGNLDQWSYFRNGIEVYRDIDSNYDRRTDQYRWLGSAGTRWGDDQDQDGVIDQWRQISAAEVGEELFYAIKDRDAERFRRLLLTSEELRQLQLGEQMNKEITAKVREASTKFENFAKSQKQISARSEWSQFGTSRPSAIPQGNAGMKQDLIVYDHASALFSNGAEIGQISLGTVVNTGPNKWRLIELPQIVEENQIVNNGGAFYSMPEMVAQSVPGESSPQARLISKLFSEFDEIEKKLKSATAEADIRQLENQRAETLLNLAINTPEKSDRQNWVQQLTDTVCNAYTSERYPDGLEYLTSKISELENNDLKEQVPYLVQGVINARFSYAHRTQDRRGKAKANDRYISDLEKFVDDYPRSPFSADALLQLGLTADLSGDDTKQAIQWYRQCEKSFPNTLQGKKAAGAISRLASQGKPLQLEGKTIDGRNFNLQSRQLRDKVVVVHYWETQCDSCIEGFEELQRIGAKYKSDLLIVGANLDDDVNKVKAFLRKNRNVNWTQLHAQGGPDKSTLAVQLGIATLPVTILVDQNGHLIDGNIHVDDLDREIQRLLKKENNRRANRPNSPRR